MPTQFRSVSDRGPLRKATRRRTFRRARNGLSLTIGKIKSEGGWQVKRLFMTTSVAVLIGASSAALAGEVKGPPGIIDNTNVTAAGANANSNCAYSGLNDFDTTDLVGQLVSIVQTAADSWKFYPLPHGAPGKLGLCRGGTNEERAK